MNLARDLDLDISEVTRCSAMHSAFSRLFFF
jgi:hypothetical protein